MLPIFSSWLVWLPACGGLLLAGQTVKAIVLLLIQMTLLFYVDPLIYSLIPGNAYVIGLSIVFGTYAFGLSGVLMGPLLAGISFTFLTIYRDYLSMPLYTTQAAGTPPGGNGPPGSAGGPHSQADFTAAADDRRQQRQSPAV